MVERAAAGEAPSSPQPPEAGPVGPGFTASRRLQRIGTERQCRRAGAVAACQCGDGIRSADFEHVADLPLAARCFLAASLGTFELALADLREDGAEVLVLDDGGLRNLPQLVEGGVGQIEAMVADRQPAVRIIDDGDALAA